MKIVHSSHSKQKSTEQTITYNPQDHDNPGNTRQRRHALYTIR
jgi:hypothetical protein